MDQTFELCRLGRGRFTFIPAQKGTLVFAVVKDELDPLEARQALQPHSCEPEGLRDLQISDVPRSWPIERAPIQVALNAYHRELEQLLGVED